MFNDILTGRASIEPKPEPESPYRKESVPEKTVTCSTCGKDFRIKVDAPATRCKACELVIAQQLAAVAARAQAESLASIEARDRSRRWTRFALVAVSALAVAFLRYQWRKDMSGVAEPQASYAFGPASEYAYKMSSFASSMCFCKDLACARDVERQFDVWSHTPEGSPTDDDAESAVAEVQRYSDCMSALESAH